jgi:hypothetical protein
MAKGGWQWKYPVSHPETKQVPVRFRIFSVLVKKFSQKGVRVSLRNRDMFTWFNEQGDVPP